MADRHRPQRTSHYNHQRSSQRSSLPSSLPSEPEPSLADEHAAPPPPIPHTRQSRTLGLLPATARHGPSPRATELYTVSYLVLFSILGTLARLGLQWLTSYPAAPSTFPVLWPNFAGTLVMGFLAHDLRLFRQEWGHQQTDTSTSHAKVKKTIPLYIGLTTGFCGSFTSFSSFMRDVFLAFLNELHPPATTA